MQRRLTLTLASAALLAAAASAHASVAEGPTVSDSSFENPALTADSYAYDPVAEGIEFYNGGGGIQSNGSAFGFADAPDGVQTAFLQTGGDLTMEIDGLTAGQSYTFSFYLADRSGYASNPVDVSYNDEVDPDFGKFAAAGTAFTQMTTGSFTANASTGFLTFASTTTGTTDTDVGIDAVTINPSPTVSAAPEPSTWAMMILGLGGIGAAFRQAKRRHGLRFRDAFAA